MLNNGGIHSSVALLHRTTKFPPTKSSCTFRIFRNTDVLSRYTNEYKLLLSLYYIYMPYNRLH